MKVDIGLTIENASKVFLYSLVVLWTVLLILFVLLVHNMFLILQDKTYFLASISYLTLHPKVNLTLHPKVKVKLCCSLKKIYIFFSEPTVATATSSITTRNAASTTRNVAISANRNTDKGMFV